MIKRRISRPINIGKVTVGGNAPIAVQSMTKTDTRNVKATLSQIRELADCGCEIVRLAVPDDEAAQALSAIKVKSPIPVIADIHFDYRLALAALDAGCDGLRLNPGNIGDPKKIALIVKSAKERAVPIRIGVNAGSLPPAKTRPRSISKYMVEVALQQIDLLESMDFDLIKVSLKAFDVPTTIEAYRLIATKTDYPLHLGITESGVPRTGLIRSTAGIAILLYEGIGDTLRVSLSTGPIEEVIAGFEILKSTDSPFLKSGAIIAKTHHERYDGKGYPDGLKGEEIHLFGRIVAVSDVFDALMTRRPYKDPVPFDKAVEVVKESKGKHFDPVIVDHFLKNLNRVKKISNIFRDI